MITKKNFLNKKFLYFFFLFLIILAFTSQQSSFAQQSKESSDFVPSGTTTDVPVESKQTKPYVYQPVDEDFWQEVEEELKNENFDTVIKIGFDREKEFGADSDDGIEGRLAAGIALRHMKIYFAASVLFEDIIKKKLSSELAQKALYELSQIDIESIQDKVDVVDDLLNSNEFGNLHPDIQSYVSYYVSISDLINGFRNWGMKQAKQVQSSSYWGQKTIYLKALNEVSQGKITEAQTRFQKLEDDDKTYDYFKKRSLLQLARIYFEKKNYEKANSIYYDLRKFPAREKGRILLERAWTLFYLKDYSEALGLLQALKSPVYMVSVTPERYTLEMLIYKNLCYYNKVSQVALEFYNVFDDALKNIHRRHDLKKVDTIVHMALNNMRLQEQANWIDQLRSEEVMVRKLGLNRYSFFKNILERYKNKDLEVQQRLYYAMEKIFPKISETILDYEEQVKFLDYTAKLDALRIVRPGEDRNYKAQKMSYIKFDKIFWPVEDEYWIDELDDYRVLIKSQCNDSSIDDQSTDDKNLIKQFGKEFE